MAGFEAREVNLWEWQAGQMCRYSNEVTFIEM